MKYERGKTISSYIDRSGDALLELVIDKGLGDPIDLTNISRIARLAKSSK